MGRFVTVSLVVGMVAGSVVLAQDNPFDFSNSRTATSAKSGRAAQLLGEAPTPSETESEIQTVSGESLPNYAEQLFGVEGTNRYRRAIGPYSPEDEATQRRTVSVTPKHPATAAPSAPAARAANPPAQAAAARQPFPEPDRSRTRFTSHDLKPRDTQATLQRFDQFLKSREASPSGAGRTDSVNNGFSIQRVTSSQPESAAPAFDGADVPVRTSNLTAEAAAPWETSAPQADAAAMPSEPASSRLTDPISIGTPRRAASVSRPSSTIPTTQDRTLPARSTTTFTPDPAAAPDRQDEQPTTRFVAAPLADTTFRAESEPAAPAVLATWKTVSPLNVGQECTCELVVTNAGRGVAQRVAVEALLPSHVKIVSISPQPVEREQFLGWKLDELAAGASQTITLVVVPSQPGPLEAAAHVRFTGTNVASLSVAQPMLEVVVDGPQQVSVGDPASHIVTVRNPGSGIASNVRLEALIPTGLQHARGERVMMDIGALTPGETRAVRLALEAVGGGAQVLQVNARADAGLVQTASWEVHVIAPSLQAAIEGPGLRYLGREAMYTLRVLNDGAAATDNVQMMHRIPEGFTFVQADRGAKFDPSTRVLNWFVGRLETGQQQELRVSLMAQTAGDFVHAVRALSEHGTSADAQMQTHIEGVPSLAIEVADLDDPVEVGTETAYEIRIVNEGTAAARDVSVSCELPAGVSFVSAAGPTDGHASGDLVTFQPAAAVAAGETLTYQVRVQGRTAGDVRFRCRVTSETLTQPLLSEELTKFYAE